MSIYNPDLKQDGMPISWLDTVIMETTPAHFKAHFWLDIPSLDEYW
jgi:hypothetical protein